METILAYKPKCGCKNKTYRTKTACLAHEKWCMYSPDSHSCPTCMSYLGYGCNLNILNSLKKYPFIMKCGIAKHCPYWEYNDEYKRK